jgi:hypothetical protein
MHVFTVLGDIMTVERTWSKSKPFSRPNIHLCLTIDHQSCHDSNRTRADQEKKSCTVTVQADHVLPHWRSRRRGISSRGRRLFASIPEIRTCIWNRTHAIESRTDPCPHRNSLLQLRPRPNIQLALFATPHNTMRSLGRRSGRIERSHPVFLDFEPPPAASATCSFAIWKTLLLFWDVHVLVDDSQP